jgi:hypothetical protein
MSGLPDAAGVSAITAAALVSFCDAWNSSSAVMMRGRRSRSSMPANQRRQLWHEIGAQSAIVDSAIASERPQEAGLSREGSNRA